MIAPLRPTLLFLRSKWQWNSTFALTHTHHTLYAPRPTRLNSTMWSDILRQATQNTVSEYIYRRHTTHTHRHTLIKRNNLTWQRNFRMWHSSGNSSENCDYNSLRMKSIMFSLSLFRSLSLCRFLFCLSVFGWYVSPGIASTSTLTRRKRRRKKSEKLPLITNWFRLNPDHWWWMVA